LVSGVSAERRDTGGIAVGAAPRRIWLCADDYGISPSVNGAIRDLIERGRINATSVMVVAPSFHRSEAVPLNLIRKRGARVAVGLHLTLSAPFRPLSEGFTPLRNGSFRSLGTMLARASLSWLDDEALTAEIAAQIRMFIHTFERPPDFIDGHQHVQIFPQVREAVLKVAKDMTPAAWIRQCGRAGPLTLTDRIGDRKGLLLDVLSRRFRERAAAMDVPTNPGFAGTYAFDHSADFAALFPRFLDGLPDGGVVMCHPGVVDTELRRLDPLTTLREKEYAYFAGETFPRLMASAGVRLA
jgi:predicted glycoside hydrolase/deacetylase ChbG (UPF0249 family)